VSVWTNRVRGRLDAVRAGGRWRRVRTFDGAGPGFVLDDGRPAVSFASND
jgi:hypothetical protein